MFALGGFDFNVARLAACLVFIKQNIQSGFLSHYRVTVADTGNGY